MDCKLLEGDSSEYFELFKESGWEHVCSYGSFHFFTAPKGTIPIYTERENYLSKYKSPKIVFHELLIISFIGLAISLLISHFAYNKVNNLIFHILIYLAVGLSAGILAASLLTSIALFIREKKIK